MNKTPGIYCITNIINNKVYIGSTINLDRRCKDHRRALNHNSHSNAKLQSSWNKYGEQAFIFFVLTECSKDLLKPFEQAAIDKYDAANSGYNIQKQVTLSPEDICKARAASTTPRPPCSESTKQKISEANKGNQAWLGKKHSEETKAKIGEINRQHQLGRTHSEETKAKMRDVRKAFWNSDNKTAKQTREKLITRNKSK